MYKEGTPIRLVGVRVDGLTEEGETQLSLFKDEENEKQEKIDKAIDKIKEKYGYNSITRAGEMSIKNIFEKNTKI